MNKAIFIDKDGTLIPDIPYNVNPELITLSNTAIPALKLLQKQNYLLIVISNQSGVARGYFKEEELQHVSSAITTLVSKDGITINGFYYCPHYKEGTVKEYAIDCDCRKPKPGLLLRAVKDFDIDVKQSWMIGDILNDVEAGKAACCKTVLIKNGNETEWLMNENRQPDFIAGNLLEAAQTIVKHS